MIDEQCGADPFENGYDQKLSEKEYRERIKYLMRCHDDSTDEIERLRAENARMREALEKIKSQVTPYANSTVRRIKNIASAALGEEKK